MNEDIVKRLLEVNEKAQKASDIKFYIVSFLLAFMVAMYFLCPATTDITLDSDDATESEITQTVES